MNAMEEDLVECPGDAHELDCTFNPSSQDAYGPGYHDCDMCDNVGYVTKEVYNEWEQDCLAYKLKTGKQYKTYIR